MAVVGLFAQKALIVESSKGAQPGTGGKHPAIRSFHNLVSRLSFSRPLSIQFNTILFLLHSWLITSLVDSLALNHSTMP
ncbi:hypothetical protein H0H92_011042 [Tricholoma furcatifolium]|nr:hypothetical protein H0H92_011042 [Tricholoma furcatifolium]